MPKALARPKSALSAFYTARLVAVCQLTCNLEITRLVDEQVLRLEVAVQDPVRVAVVEALDELVGEFLGVSCSSSVRAI